MKKIMIIGLLPFLFSCSELSTMAIDRATLPALKDKTLSLVIHESPDFMAMTPDKSMLTMASVAAANAEGSQLVEKNGIKDPADMICKQMARFVSENYGLSYNEHLMIKAQSKAMDNLVRLANGRDYLLDVETLGWSFNYNGFNHSEYYVRYTLKTRLIDVDNAMSIGQSACDYDTIKVGKPFVSYEKLVENDAAYIKQTLVDATTYCVDKFKAELPLKN